MVPTRGIRVSLRSKNQHVVVCIAAFMLSAVTLSTAPTAAAQAQPGSTPEPNRAELLKIKPDLGGFRNGVAIEPDPMDFADHSGYTSIFDGKTLTGWDGSRTCGK